MFQIRKFLLLTSCLIALLCATQAKATNNNTKLFSVSGYIKDSKTGEVLIGATVYIKALKTNATSNEYGFYSLSAAPGTYDIEFSYVGYQNTVKSVDLSNNVKLNVELVENIQEIQEIVISSERKSEKIKKAEMSVTKLEMKTIKKIPALLGEVDVIKAIQLLPGVQATSEGSSGFSVRGGSADQNLILLDEATVYNASHLMGFFSVFNNDAVKDVKLYKGDIPAAYGGRLAALLDVRMKEGNSKDFAVSGGAGLLSSRLTIEGPIIKERTSFIVSGRRTYYDLFFPLFKSSSAELANSKLYFYDLNAKINHQINENNRLFLSAYLGNDVFNFNKQFGFNFGNNTGTLRWNHQYNSILFSNLSLTATKYKYELGTSEQGANGFTWDSYLADYSAKLDFNLFPNSSNTLKFGASSTYHTISPAFVVAFKDTFSIPKNYALEHGIYLSNEQQVTDNLSIKYGVRVSIFQNIGKGLLYHYDKNYNTTDSVVYGTNVVFKTQTGWEPRLGMAYVLNDASSVKASYSRTIQYMQLASNSTGGMPLDIWFFSGPNIKPQIANQGAIGYFHNFNNDAFETSVELFYKRMDNAIDFKENAALLFNKKLDGEVRAGLARALGVELMVQYDIDRFNGWVSYTYSKTERKIPSINSGNWYNAPYDKPHSVNVVFTFEMNKTISLSANWVYATGAPVTFPSDRWGYGNMINKLYVRRNAYRLPDYHRLDLSVTIKQKDSKIQVFNKERIWQGEWVLGLYNAYNRKNAWMINFVEDPKKPGATYADKISILSILPSVTYNFKF